MDQKLLESLEATYDGIGEPDMYAVYCLRCLPPPRKSKVKDRLGTVPWWFEDAINADHLFYAGYTSNLHKRVKQHYDGEGAIFTKVCQPTEVVLARWTPYEHAARNIEDAMPRHIKMLDLKQQVEQDELPKQYADVFVYQH